jgi:hypothetical protein
MFSSRPKRIGAGMVLSISSATELTPILASITDFSAELGPMCRLENVLISLRLIYGHKYTMKRGIYGNCSPL